MTDSAEVSLGKLSDTSGDRAIAIIDQQRLRQSRQRADSGPLAASSIGGMIKIEVRDRLLFGTLSALEADRNDESSIHAEIEFVGEGSADADGNVVEFRRGVSLYPHPGDLVRFASEIDMERIFAPPKEPHIEVGTVFPTEHVRAPILYDRLLGRHFAIFGSSGAGKSTFVTLMLHRITERAPHAHMVILDPHGEYAKAFGAAAQVWDVNSLRLPYWAMNLAEHCEAFVLAEGDAKTASDSILAKCLLKARSLNLYVSEDVKLTADSPIAYQMRDLTGAIEEESGRLEKMAEAGLYTQLRLAIEQFCNDPRYRFIFDPALYNSSIEQLLADILRMPNSGKPVSIIDLAGVPTEILNVVVSTLARLILDFAIWAPREQRPPILIVCEEAHRYLPQVKSAATRSVDRQLERIAREGRKYGVCLAMITQRPSELSETAMSQCGTIISLRLNNDKDQAYLKAGMPEGARGFVDSIATLKNRECIVAGDGVPLPMRVLIDMLEEELRPASDDPSFSEGWSHGGAGPELIAETVRRWREES
jgi:uncharacterized protein